MKLAMERSFRLRWHELGHLQHRQQVFDRQVLSLSDGYTIVEKVGPVIFKGSRYDINDQKTCDNKCGSMEMTSLWCFQYRAEGSAGGIQCKSTFVAQNRIALRVSLVCLARRASKNFISTEVKLWLF